MADPIRINETCACGATINATGSAYRHDDDHRSPRGAEEIVERWRADHQHHEPTPPTIDSPDSDATNAGALERDAVLGLLRERTENAAMRANSWGNSLEYNAIVSELRVLVGLIQQGTHTQPAPTALAADVDS